MICNDIRFLLKILEETEIFKTTDTLSPKINTGPFIVTPNDQKMYLTFNSDL
jgi:hypothetical protein